MIESLKHPWPWYIAGPLIGLIVPALLILGNKSFGISASLRHLSAACLPSKIPFFQYDWKKEAWNLFFVFGIFIGAMLVTVFLADSEAVKVNPKLVNKLQQYGISNY